ncbi:MAG TPA: metal-binding protein [Desulfosporosinus sp.]|nr:metal-binding protein [Desulfosporosinus sp.]
MNSNIDNLISFVNSLGVNQVAIISVDDIQFDDNFRMYCEQNSCGKHNKNWMCPPAVGSIGELKEKALKFTQGLLFQTVYQLEDSYDFEGMQEGTEAHTKLLRKVLDSIKSTRVFKEFLPLNVGPCTYCGRCSFLDGEECRFPEEAVSSVEAYGIDVMALEKSCGMSYNNGKNTVSCVSLILFNPYQVE